MIGVERHNTTVLGIRRGNNPYCCWADSGGFFSSRTEHIQQDNFRRKLHVAWHFGSIVGLSFGNCWAEIDVPRECWKLDKYTFKNVPTSVWGHILVPKPKVFND